MKKSLILIILTLLFLGSCKKKENSEISYLVPRSEVPVWLIEIIEETEATMTSENRPDLEIGAWLRYKYKKEFYFEYYNALMSSFPPIYNYEGERVMLDQEDFQKYSENKCCRQFVWKGSSYIDF
jgi:hypothetical protein